MPTSRTRSRGCILRCALELDGCRSLGVRGQLFELKVPVVHRASLIRYLVLSPRAGSLVTLGSDVVQELAPDLAGRRGALRPAGRRPGRPTTHLTKVPSGGSPEHPGPRAVGRAEASGGVGRDAGTPRDAACHAPVAANHRCPAAELWQPSEAVRGGLGCRPGCHFACCGRVAQA